MNVNTISPPDRASFDTALSAVLLEHRTLRSLAVSVCAQISSSETDAISLAKLMATHESTEARLFALPFVTRPPADVVTSSVRAHQLGLEYTNRKSSLSPSRAAVVFAEAVLNHLTAEEDWLAHEEYQNEYLRSSA